MTVTVGEIISAIDRARNKIKEEYNKPMPDDVIVDILQDYIVILENLTVKR